MKHGQLEALLRPPIEIYSALAAAGCGLVALAAPWALMLPPTLGLLVALAAFGFASIRAREAWTVWRYQLGLQRYKITAIAPHRLPRLADRIYLGHGFAWGQKHTQRRIDAQRPEAQPYITPGTLWSVLRAGVKALAHTPLAPLARMLTSPRYWWNPIGDQPDLGGTPLLHGV